MRGNPCQSTVASLALMRRDSVSVLFQWMCDYVSAVVPDNRDAV